MAPKFNTQTNVLLTGHCDVGRHHTCAGRYGQGEHWMTCQCGCHTLPATMTSPVRFDDSLDNELQYVALVPVVDLVASPTYGCSR